MSLRLGKNILSDVRLEVTAIITPPPLRGERCGESGKNVGQNIRIRYRWFQPSFKKGQNVFSKSRVTV